MLITLALHRLTPHSRFCIARLYFGHRKIEITLKIYHKVGLAAGVRTGESGTGTNK